MASLDDKRIHDADVLEAIRTNLCSCPSASHIRDRMARRPFSKWWTRGAVLAKLKRMEVAGKVKRLPTVYKTQIAWGIS